MTPHGRRVVSLVVVLSLSPFVLIAVEHGPRLLETRRGPVELEVVRTADDLLGTQSISLGRGVTVHLGIDATECPHGGAVLVYCATEGYHATERENADSLGPVRVVLRKRESLNRLEECTKRAQPRDPGLYVKAIPIAEPGPHEIVVSAADGKTLARCTVTGTDRPFHSLAGFAASPWNDLLESRDRPALPSFSGTWARPLEDGDLPSLLGRPALVIAKKGDVFTITSPDGLEVGGDIASDRLLGRWWVNDRPLLMNESKPVEKLARNHSGKIAIARCYDFRLDVTPAELGAKSGDTVGLELVYCPEGWTLTLERPGGLEQSRDVNGYAPLRTNRIDFILP